MRTNAETRAQTSARLTPALALLSAAQTMPSCHQVRAAGRRRGSARPSASPTERHTLDLRARAGPPARTPRHPRPPREPVRRVRITRASCVRVWLHAWLLSLLLQLDGIWVATRSSALAGGYRTGLGPRLVSDYA